MCVVCIIIFHHSVLVLKFKVEGELLSDKEAV